MYITKGTKMKKLLSTALLLSISSITRPMQDAPAEKLCTMPSEEVLKTVVCSDSMKYFCEKVSLCKELADQERHPLGVAMALEFAIADFEDNLRKVSPGCSNEQLQRQQISADNTMALMHQTKENTIRNILKASSCNCDPVKVLIDAGIFKQKQN
jgi:hypothetical protein